jgi:hypothetical protein
VVVDFAGSAGKAASAAKSKQASAVPKKPGKRWLRRTFWLLALTGSAAYLVRTYYPWSEPPPEQPTERPGAARSTAADVTPPRPAPSEPSPMPTPSASEPVPFAPLLGEYSDKQDAGCKRPLRIALPRAGDEAFALEITRQNGDVWKLTEGNGPDAFVQDRIFDASGTLLRPPAKKPQWIIERSGNRLTLTYAGTQFKEEYLLCKAQ